jgi:uncharacterized protein
VKKSNKFLLVSLLFTFVLILGACSGSQKTSEGESNNNKTDESKNTESKDTQSNKEKVLLTIGTAGSGGTNYYIGAGIADAVKDMYPNINITPEGTAGGVENARRVASGDLDLGLMSASDLMTVIEDGSVKTDQLMAIGSGHRTILHAVGRPDLGTNVPEEVFKKGLKYGYGEPGSAVQAYAEANLNMVGLTGADVKTVQLSQAEQVDALKDGNIDIATLGGGVPVAAATDIAQTLGGITILNFTEEHLKKIKKEYPFLFLETLPAGTYKGQDKDVTTYGYANITFVSPDLPNEVVKEITKAMYENAKLIERVHPAGAQYSVDGAFNGADFYTDYGLKFHPGAIEYFKEIGVWDEKYK